VKKEINPAVGWVALVVVAIVVAVVGFKMFVPPPPEMDKKAGDATMQKVQAGGKMYEPPPGAVPGSRGSDGSGNSGSGGSGSGSSSPGGYNMTPPSH